MPVLVRLSMSTKRPFPSATDIALSQESSSTLTAYLQKHARLKIVDEDGLEEPIAIPEEAAHLLADILKEMAKGNTVSLVPVHSEMSTQQAADLLNVSRPFLVNLLESGEIPFRKVGKHRRVRFTDLMDYKERDDAARGAILDELVAEAQELGLGYD